MTSRWLKFIFFFIFFKSRKSFQRHTRNQRNLLNDLPPCGTIFSFDFWNLMIPIIQSIVIFMFPFVIKSQIELWFCFLDFSCSFLVFLFDWPIQFYQQQQTFVVLIQSFSSRDVFWYFLFISSRKNRTDQTDRSRPRALSVATSSSTSFSRIEEFSSFFKKKKGETNISRKFLPPFTHWKVLENFVHAWLKFYYFSKQVAGATCFQPTAYVAAPNSRNILSPFDNKSVGSN